MARAWPARWRRGARERVLDQGEELLRQVVGPSRLEQKPVHSVAHDFAGAARSAGDDDKSRGHRLHLGDAKWFRRRGGEHQHVAAGEKRGKAGSVEKPGEGDFSLQPGSADNFRQFGGKGRIRRIACDFRRKGDTGPVQPQQGVDQDVRPLEGKDQAGKADAQAAGVGQEEPKEAVHARPGIDCLDTCGRIARLAEDPPRPIAAGADAVEGGPGLPFHGVARLRVAERVDDGQPCAEGRLYGKVLEEVHVAK